MDYKNHLEKSIEYKAKYYITKGVKILFFILLAVAFLLLMTYVFMLLWNWLMPEIFNLPTLNYWKALGLIVLAKIIFGFGFGDSDRPNSKASKSKKWSRNKKCGSLRKDFSEWKHYDAFWKEEGEKAYQDFIARKQNKALEE